MSEKSTQKNPKIIELRKKIIKYGPKALTSTELLMLILGREMKKTDVKSLTKVILKEIEKSPKPNNDEIKITYRLYEVGKIVGIKVIDHIIITKTLFFCFQAEGIIKKWDDNYE